MARGCAPKLPPCEALSPHKPSLPRCRLQQQKCGERRKAQRGGDDQDAASHRIEQEAEGERRRRLREPRAMVNTPLPAPWKIANTPAAAPPAITTIAAPKGCMRQASRVETIGW